MTEWVLRLDLRCPEFAGSSADIHQAGLDMVAWADAHGFDTCMLSEHHGSPDGYLPSPMVYGAAVAARTQRLTLRISALVLPLHDFLRVAEDLAVLDRISAGRLEVVVVAGFLPDEFRMLDRDFATRGRQLEEGVAVLRAAWQGTPFEYRGRSVTVTPAPWRPGGPLLLLGGSSVRAARRAARIADGFVPSIPGLYEDYRQACEALGRTAAPAPAIGAAATFVSEDPDSTWAQIAPHALHETNSYARWYAQSGVVGPYQPVDTAEALQRTGLYQVLTPAQCIDAVRALGPHAQLYVHPLLAGLDPAIGWETLELIAAKVMPAVQARTSWPGE